MSIESILVPKPNVPKRYLESLDDQIQEVLRNKTIPSDLKFSLYSHILSKWNATQENLKKPTKLTVTSAKPERPSREMSPGERLREFIDAVPTVEVRSDGSLVVNNKVIRNSNIESILTDLTHNKKGRIPAGSRQVAKELREHSVPIKLITNLNRHDWFADDISEPVWKNY